jgi:hypothetical protein
MIDYGFKWPIQYLISRNANSMGIKWPLLVFDQKQPVNFHTTCQNPMYVMIKRENTSPNYNVE